MSCAVGVDGAACASCQATASTKLSSALTSKSLSACSKMWCVSHLAKVLQIPDPLSGEAASSSADAPSCPKDLAPPPTQTDAARVGAIAVLKYRLARCINNKWETRRGEDASERLERVRACIASGRHPFTNELADLKLTPEEWSDVEKNVRGTVEARIQDAPQTPAAPLPPPQTRSCMRRPGDQGASKSVSFAQNPDVVLVESWKEYDL